MTKEQQQKNESEFSSVKSSYDSLSVLKDEIEWFLHRIDVAIDNDFFEDGANLGNVLDVTTAFMGSTDEKRLQLAKEDIRRLVNMGDQLSKR